MLLGVVSSSKAESTSPPIAKPKVVATTSLLRDLVYQICGDTVELDSLMGAGVDPHLYKVTPGDVRKLSQGDYIVFHGLHLEGRMGDALESLGKKKPTVTAAEMLDPSVLRRPEEGIPDPHVWFDVSLWSDVSRKLSSKLAELLPAHAEQYRSAGALYAAELDALDREILRSIQSIPVSQRVLVTAHDAFGYFGRRYGIEVRGVQGISTDSEAGLRHIQGLIDEIVSRKVRAVFMETSVGERSVKALLDGAKSQGHSVALAGPLYSDALGEPGSGAETFIGMVRANVRQIVEALGGEFKPTGK